MHIESDHRLTQAHPLLQEAVEHVAQHQIRNRGTVGGSLAHAEPSVEMPAIAVTRDAEYAIVGSTGACREKAVDFFKGALITNLAADEIFTEVPLPPSPAMRRWTFLEFTRRGDFAMAGVALHYKSGRSWQSAECPRWRFRRRDSPVRLPPAERAMNGQTLSEHTTPPPPRSQGRWLSRRPVSMRRQSTAALC